MQKTFFFTHQTATTCVLITLWSMLWFSINAESSDAIFHGYDDKRIIDYLHSLRFYFPYAAAILSIVWILCIGKKPNIKLWQTGIICYASTILLSGLWHGADFKLLHFHAAMICTITVTVIGSVISEEINKTNEADLIGIYAKTSIIILTAVLAVSFLRDVVLAIVMEQVQGYAIQGRAPRQFGMEAPRPTGLSRSAAILSLVCLIIYGSEKYRYKALYYFGSFFLALVIFYQARGTISALVVSTIVVILCLPKSKKPRPVDIIKFLILSVVFFIGIIAFLYSIIYLAAFAKAIFLQIFNFSLSYDFISPMTRMEALFRTISSGDFSSGRLGIWESAMELAKTSPFFGFGSQADRLYLDKNVSNIVIYSLICGGVVSLLFVGLALTKTITNIWFSITRKLADEHGFYDYRTLCAVAVFTFLTFRGVFENSYSLFSIDFLVVVPAIWHLNLSLFKEKKIKNLDKSH